MTNNTIAPKITSWAELWATDREVLNVGEVASLLGVDPRTVASSVHAGELPGTRLGRRLLIPRAPLLDRLGVRAPAA
ncbi:helix-turn-helix domain-containing protein [Cellulosimicrobium sp. NPDC057127]|uniref:helix-turn-helix domain-containing protein n=1 Tax=Cellulosimicrobium sp. NPDC057127 TaxID=3346026 RepID=UPI003643D672